MTVNETGTFSRRKIIMAATNPRESFIKSDVAKFFGMILVAIIVFVAFVAVENYTDYIVSSHKATSQELLEISNPIGTGAEIRAHYYPVVVAATVIEKNNRYELRIVDFGSQYWVQKYRLKLLAADGTVLTMDRNLPKAIRMDKNDVLPISTDKEIKRWSIKFLDL
ncbi:MAG: hypothetical protein ABIC96_04620 [Patescibacteria group bacterium]